MVVFRASGYGTVRLSRFGGRLGSIVCYNRSYRGDLSIFVYDIFSSGSGFERLLRAFFLGEEVAYGIDRFSVCGLYRVDISAMFVRQQNRFMQKYSLGFDKDQVVVVELNGNIMRNHKDSYVGGLKEYPGIEDVAFCRQKFGSEDSYRTWSGIYKEQSVGFTSLAVSWNFFKVMGIPLIGGRMLPSLMRKATAIAMYSINKWRDKWSMEPNDIMRIPWLEEESAMVP